MREPPPYPRIPRLPTGGKGDADDLQSEPALVRALTTRPVHVEEKLDGMNVAIVLDAVGWPVPFARSGKTSGDRGGQLGRIRVWIGDRAAALQRLLASHAVIYGEWLRRRHSVPYDALPDWLVVLDLRNDGGEIVSSATRDDACASAGLATPPLLYAGVVGELEALPRLVAKSRFGSAPAEGIVLRGTNERGTPTVAKWLSPSYQRATDLELSRYADNALASSAERFP